MRTLCFVRAIEREHITYSLSTDVTIDETGWKCRRVRTGIYPLPLLVCEIASHLYIYAELDSQMIFARVIESHLRHPQA